MPKAKKVSTPGTGDQKRDKKRRNREEEKEKKRRKKKKDKTTAGRPKKVKRLGRNNIKLRSTYTKEDMEEAVRLVQNENMSIKSAANHINDRKKSRVPRTTLNDWLLGNKTTAPKLGRPTELSVEAENALVKCLKMCASFQYPMRKSDLQALVQSYVIENSVVTRWPDGKPQKDWCHHFSKRWRHEIKLRKPTNIKRSRARVSPASIREFFTRIRPHLEAVPATHIINYDETNFQVPVPFTSGYQYRYR